MIRHIVWWTLKEEFSGDKAAETLESLLEAAQVLRDLPSVKSFEMSASIEASTTLPCQLILTTTHDSMERLDEYQLDPIHVQFAENLKLRVASRSCVDFEYK